MPAAGIFTGLILTLLALNMAAQSGFDLPGLLVERAEKDRSFRDSANSPLEPEALDNFAGLSYFPPSGNYYVQATLERFTKPDTLRMKTSTAREPLYEIYGRLVFELGDSTFRLLAYRQPADDGGMEDSVLFIPFTDLTTGESTYGGGRYLDVAIPQGDSLVIDFNDAYNPYCAYSDRWSCPVPPPENFINIAIEAGERYPCLKKSHD